MKIITILNYFLAMILRTVTEHIIGIILKAFSIPQRFTFQILELALQLKITISQKAA